jgi:hypothetical protein
MRKFAPLFLLLPLVALGVYACDEVENPLDTESQASETPLFAPGGNKGPMPKIYYLNYSTDGSCDEAWTAEGNLESYSTITPVGSGSCHVEIETTFDISDCAPVATAHGADSYVVVDTMEDTELWVWIEARAGGNPDQDFSLILACP